MTIPVVRVRTRKPKARTGCRTCKARRIKCDEGRPACVRCSSTGRKCDGYELSSSEGERLNSAPSRNAVRALVPFTPPPIVIAFTFSSNLTDEEIHGWDFFRTKTVPEIRGCFPSDLWDTAILQFGHREPSILHAAIAVGFTHRVYKAGQLQTTRLYPSSPKFESRTDIFSRSDVAYPTAVRHCMRQYLKAIGSLRQRLQNAEIAYTKEVSLIACLLFICLENFSGVAVDGITHLRKGLSILSSGRSLTDNSVINETPSKIVLRRDPDALMDKLTAVFARLDYESTMFGVISPCLDLIPEQSILKGQLSIPPILSTLGEARQYLDTIASAVFRFRGDLLAIAIQKFPDQPHPTDMGTCVLTQHATAKKLNISAMPKLLERRRQLQTAVTIWLSAFNALKEQTHSTLDAQDTRALSMLEVQQFYLWYQVMHAHSKYEMGADSFNSDWERVVDAAAVYLYGMQPHLLTGENRSLTFTLESGVMPCLFLAAVKCRQPRIRRKAIAMLRETPCQEGMWRTAIVIEHALKVTEMEEAAANFEGELTDSSQIPEHARVGSVVYTMDKQPGYGRIICARYRHETDGKLYVWEEKFKLKDERTWAASEVIDWDWPLFAKWRKLSED